MTAVPEIRARGYVAGRYDQRAGLPHTPRMIPEGQCVACNRWCPPNNLFCTACRDRVPDALAARISRARDDAAAAVTVTQMQVNFGRAVWDAIDYLEQSR